MKILSPAATSFMNPSPAAILFLNSNAESTDGLTSRRKVSRAGSRASTTSPKPVSPTTITSRSLPARSSPRATEPYTKAARMCGASGINASRNTSATPTVFFRMLRRSS